MPLAFETQGAWGVGSGYVCCGTGEENDGSHGGYPRDGVFPSASLGDDSVWQCYCLPGFDTGGGCVLELTFFLQLIFYMCIYFK